MIRWLTENGDKFEKTASNTNNPGKGFIEYHDDSDKDSEEEGDDMMDL